MTATILVNTELDDDIAEFVALQEECDALISTCRIAYSGIGYMHESMEQICTEIDLLVASVSALLSETTAFLRLTSSEMRAADNQSAQNLSTIGTE